jgi:DNA-binding IclR family transcriptional regulator
MLQDTEDRRGIGSVDTAMTILKVFARDSGPLSLKEVSDRTGMATSKLHRYLSSLVAQGMLSQKARSGRYDLGPFATELGLSALARTDFVNRTADVLPDLVAATGCTAMLSVWGASGPVIVRWERARNHIVTALGLGTVMPLVHSATGQVFLGFAPTNLTDPLIGDSDSKLVEDLKKTVRRDGYSSVGGDFIPGLYALAAPVLNWQGEAETVITLIATDRALIDPKGPAIGALIRTCRSVSLPSGDADA